MSVQMQLHTSPYFDYWLSLPDGFDRSERLPLIVFLHGAGEVGPDTQKVRIHGVPKIIEREPWSNMRVITLSPQCQEGRIWNTQIYSLKQLIDDVAREYNADPDRISITGLSMGGYGTWMAAQTFPDFFSAAAPICGGGIIWLAYVLKNTTIRAFHGGQDSTVPVHNSIEMVDAVNAAGGHAELVIFHELSHNSWERAYEHTDLIEWLAAQKRH